jgi:hypothetical protein
MPSDTELLSGIGARLANHADPEIVGQGSGPREREAGHHGQNGGKRHGGDESEKRGTPQQLGKERSGHVAALVHGPDGVRAYQDHGAKAEDKGQQVEESDETGGNEDRGASRAGVRHGVESHQYVGQSGGAEHQGHPQ